MAIWNLRREVAKGIITPEVGDTYKLVRVRDTIETIIGQSYTIPNLPYEENTLKLSFHKVEFLADVERDALSEAERDAIDDDDKCQVTKKKDQAE